MPGNTTMDERTLRLLLAEHDCHVTVLSQPYPSDGQLYCNGTWDGWGCWNYTLSGTRAWAYCPAHMPGFDPTLKAYKDCNPDGSWWRVPMNNKTWTNYTSCVNTRELVDHIRMIHIFIAGYTFSIIALAVSIFIFFYFRQLQCDRVTIHKNLFSSYILNGMSWILYYTLAAMDAEVLDNNPVWCQTLHVITQYFVAVNFFWMFCEGLYLHTIIVVAFTSGKTLLISCFVIGWALPVLTTVTYASARGKSPNDNERIKCWTEESSFQWIVLAPIVLTIALNFAFLCNIVRVLVTKLRAVNSPDTNQTRKAVRATLILIPLLGLQYILLPLRPEKDSPFLEAYLYASAIVTSSQGLFVALIFCFMNGEVLAVLKRKWGQHRLMAGKSTMGRTTLYTQTTMSCAEQNHVNQQPPKSPRLYDNRCQAPGGKLPKPIVSSNMMIMRKSLASDYLELENQNGKVEQSAV